MKGRDKAINSGIWPLLALGLLVLVVISGWMVSGLYARYTSTSNGEDDTARVAAFDITALGEMTQGLELDVAPGMTTPVRVQVMNRCEVAVAYTITIQNQTNNLPAMTYTLNGVPLADATTASVNLPAGEAAENLELLIAWSASTEDVDTNLAYRGMIDYLTITLTATQID